MYRLMENLKIRLQLISLDDLSQQKRFYQANITENKLHLQGDCCAGGIQLLKTVSNPSHLLLFHRFGKSSSPYLPHPCKITQCPGVSQQPVGCSCTWHSTLAARKTVRRIMPCHQQHKKLREQRNHFGIK